MPAAHVLDATEVPVQPSPAIRCPIQTPPFQDVPAALAFAQAATSNLPKRSASPVSEVPLNTTCVPPRAFSTEPVPVPFAQVWAVVGVAFANAAATLISPMPTVLTFVCLSCVAELMIMALTWSGFSVGRFCRIRATAPDTAAAACEVPLPRKLP